MNAPFTKVVSIGQNRETGTTHCKIKFDGKKLLITGVEGPKADGNCRGGCGQITMHEWLFDKYCKDWNAELVAKFREVWDRWHLNDMRSGSPAQEAWLRANPISPDDYKYPKSHYEVATERLTAAGLNPDGGYKYGSARLFEEIPSEVLEFLQSLPTTELKPAWV